MTWKLKDQALEAEMNRMSAGHFSQSLQTQSDTALRIGATSFSVHFGDRKGRGGTARHCIHIYADEVDGLLEQILERRGENGKEKKE